MRNIAEVESALSVECFFGGRVKGSVIRPHVDWVRDHGDRSEVIEFFQEIRPAVRVVSASRWYAFEDLIQVDRVIVTRFGNGDPGCMSDIGRYAAQQVLGRVPQPGDSSAIAQFLYRSAVLHHDDHDFGNAIYRSLGEREGQLVRANWTSFSPLYCAMTAGFYREAVRLLGGSNVEVWESECLCRGGAACRFEMMWS